MHILDKLVESYRAPEPTFTVNVTHDLRLIYRRDEEYSDLIRYEEGVAAEYDAFVKVVNGVEEYTGVHKSWKMPREKRVFRQILAVKSMLNTAEQLNENGEWVPIEWGLKHYLQFAYDLAPMWSAHLRLVSDGQVKHIHEAEASRLEETKKKSVARESSPDTSESASE